MRLSIRTLFLSATATIAVTTSATSQAAACGAFDLGCELREIIEDPGEKVRQGAENLQDAVRQGQQNVTNTLNLVDPRITQFGRDIDRWRLNLQAQILTGPILEQWIIQSRNDAIQGALPMPESIKNYMNGWYSDSQMEGVYYKIGDNGSFNLANGSLQYGEAEAITLIDVIVFRNADLANDLSLWAHELKHVTQYKDWGVHSFAVQYMQSWNSVEDPAYAVGKEYAQAFNQAALQAVPNSQIPNIVQPGPPPGASQTPYSQTCVVGPNPGDRCFLGQSLPLGSGCSCQGATRLWYGTVWN